MNFLLCIHIFLSLKTNATEHKGLFKCKIYIVNNKQLFLTLKIK